MKRGMLVLVVLSVSAAACAETGIHTAVGLVESRYAVHHHNIPLLWLAKPFLIGSGVGGLKIALFEDLHVTLKDSYSLRDGVADALGPDWHPFVENWSKSGHECTLIYVRTNRHKIGMLILTAEEQGDTTLLQVTLKPKRFGKWVKEPLEHTKKGRRGSPRSESGADLEMSSLR